MLKTIVLIGMMGSGKTSVGKELAKNLNLNFIDSDQEIEKKCKISIPSIFEKKGEDYFRKIEEKICCKLIDGKPKILSLGGGAFINSKIRKEIKNLLNNKDELDLILKDGTQKAASIANPIIEDVYKIVGFK